MFFGAGTNEADRDAYAGEHHVGFQKAACDLEIMYFDY